MGKTDAVNGRREPPGTLLLHLDPTGTGGVINRQDHRRLLSLTISGGGRAPLLL